MGLLLSPIARSQASAGVVGFWTQVSGTVTHEYAFTRDGRYESKLYGSMVYQVSYGTYVVSGNQLILTAPQTAPETYRWNIVGGLRPTLNLTDAFGAVSPFYWEKFDQRYASGVLIPYSQASLVGYWVVSHGRAHWEYAFTADGKFQSKRIGDSINEIIRGTYVVKDNAVILSPAGKPLQAFAWRLERETGARTLVLMDLYGAIEVYYEAKAGS